MDSQKFKDLGESFIDRSKKILNDNDITDDNIIYDETQTGPQEEPFLFEYSMDLLAWEKYLENLDKKNQE